jgi:hypothetical protein
MALWLIYQMFSKLPGWIVPRTDLTVMEIKILVLRHQLAVLRRAPASVLRTRPAGQDQ